MPPTLRADAADRGSDLDVHDVCDVAAFINGYAMV